MIQFLLPPLPRRLLGLALPDLVPISVSDQCIAEVGCSTCAVHMFTDVSPAALHVAALAEQLETVGVGGLNHVMVINLAVVDAATEFTSALTLRFDRMILKEPVDHVQVVNVLFDNMIARLAR